MSKGRIIIISGPSGVGKKTIIDRFINDKRFNLKYSISATTRKPRENEVHGVDYYFLSNEEFDKNIKENNFLEWAVFAGNKYGTLISEIKESSKKNNIILEIEVQGATNIMENKNIDNLLTFFIVPPSIDELEKRLKKRNTETLEKINLRIQKASEEIKMSDKYSYVIVNDNVDDAVNEFVKILEKELLDE